jgi:hypothetical protein
MTAAIAAGDIVNHVDEKLRGQVFYIYSDRPDMAKVLLFPQVGVASYRAAWKNYRVADLVKESKK